MNKKYKLLLIDDKSNHQHYTRIDILNSRQNDGNYEFDAILPQESDLKSVIPRLEQYDLILVDYKFDTAGSLFRSGGALYSILREYTKYTPVYLISILNESKEFYGFVGDFDLYISDDILATPGWIQETIISHQKLMECGSDPSKLIKKLSAPEFVYEELLNVMRPIVEQNIPTSETSGLDDVRSSLSEGLNIKIFKWLTHSFLRKEGLLASEAGVSLRLGISTEAFRSKKHIFESALYQGLFSKVANIRWWLSKVEDIVLELPDPESLRMSLGFSEFAPKLLEIGMEDLATCVKCGEIKPDALGVIDFGSHTEFFHVHTYCSTPIKTEVLEPHFRAVRLIEST